MAHSCSALTARSQLLSRHPSQRWRQALPALLAGMALVATTGFPAAAQDATWLPTPGTGNFNTDANWTPAAVPTGTAVFGTSDTTALSFSANTTIGGFTFNAGASDYTFTMDTNLIKLIFNGAGIVVNGGSAVITSNGNAVEFHNDSTAGSADITNDAFLDFYHTSTAGSADITNDAVVRFNDGSTAGSAVIVNNDGLRLFNTSTAGSSVIVNNNSLLFFNLSTAGSADITNNAVVNFLGVSTAGSAVITNDGFLTFIDTSTAGDAVITNDWNLYFQDASTAGSATITTAGGGLTLFQDTSSGGDARFIAEAGGTFEIASLASAGTTAGSIEGAGSYILGGKSLTVGSNDLSTEVSGVVSGIGGSLTKVGTGALTLSGTNTYTGGTDVDAGTLIVNGSIVTSSLTTVGNGATLMGSGALGATTFTAGGIHAPGNSIGTQTVNGDYTLLPGAILEIETNAAGGSDLLVVTGTVSLTNAILNVIAEPGAYAALTSYLIIDNDGNDAVVGTFANVTTNLAFLTPAVDYFGGTGNDVVLTLTRNHVAFVSVAETPNQFAVAQALQSLPVTDPLVDALIGQSTDGAQQAFDALSGEVHASVAGVLLNDSRFVRDAILSRLLQAHYGGGGTSSVAALASGGPTTVAVLGDAPMMGLGMGSGHAAAPPPASGLAFWTQGFGSWGDFDGNGNAASADRTLGGFVSGVDAGLGGGWRAGFALGYTQAGIGVDQRLSTADVESYHLGGYAGGRLGALAVRAGGAWTWHDIDTARTVLFPGFLDRTEASYDGDTGQVFGEVALPIVAGKSAIEPFAGLAWVSVDTSGFTEQGGLAALTSAGSDVTAGYATLGVRAATELLIDGVVVIPHASAAWQHAFDDVAADAALAFAGFDAGFTVAGVPVARDAALVEAGLLLKIDADATLGLSYQGRLAGGVDEHGFSGHLDWRF